MRWSEPAIFVVISVAISLELLEQKPILLCSVMKYFIGLFGEPKMLDLK